MLSASATGAAHAAPTQAMIFDAQHELMDASTREATLDELEWLGIDHVRVLLYWKDVAPAADGTARPGGDLTDPASYDWSRYDPVFARLRERGFRVLVTLTTPGPRWAMKDRDDYVTRPSPALFGRFVAAAGWRYGEQVEQWAIINEPNHPDFLGPQYGKGKRPVSPGIYRALFRAADDALERTGNGDDLLLMGETAPRGTGKAVAPLTFLRGALCLNSQYRKRSSCGPLDADGYAHHAYTTKAGPFFVPPGKNDVTIGVLNRLTSALDKAARARAVKRDLPIYLTEFGIQSTPDRFFGVSVTEQYEFRAISERLAYGNKRVTAFSQYLLRDDQPRDGGSASARYGGFESGLRFATGLPKRSLKAFRLTLSALRDGDRVSLWGLVRPAIGATSADVLYKNAESRTWHKLRTVRTNRRGYFTLRTSYRKTRRYKLAWGGMDGEPVRVYARRPR